MSFVLWHFTFNKTFNIKYIVSLCFTFYALTQSLHTNRNALLADVPSAAMLHVLFIFILYMFCIWNPGWFAENRDHDGCCYTGQRFNRNESVDDEIHCFLQFELYKLESCQRWQCYKGASVLVILSNETKKLS